MNWRVEILAFLVVCYNGGVEAQNCIPNPVYNVELENTSLVWDPSTNCNTTHYIVNIHTAGSLNFVYQTDDTFLNVTFLSLCRTYTFVVTAMADHIMGQQTSYEATIALPTGTDIVVSNFTGDQIDRDVLLQWQVASDYTYCVDSYKILLWREDMAEPEQITTTQSGYYITGVSQCMRFTLEISVEHLTIEHSIAKFNYTVPAATNTPSIVAVRQDVTTINTTWALESYALNKCNVTALYVNGTYFSTTIEIDDVPQRPTIDVSISGLRANSMYYFNVSVLNEAGVSRAFQMAVQTLPIDPSFKIDLDDNKAKDYYYDYDNY